MLVVKVIRPSSSACSASVSLPRATARRSSARGADGRGRACSSLISTPTTSKPLRANTSAMPAPMVPRPITPMRVNSRCSAVSTGLWEVLVMGRIHPTGQRLGRCGNRHAVLPGVPWTTRTPWTRRSPSTTRTPCRRAHWHRLDGRAHPVRRLPARLPAARGPARAVLRPRPGRRPDRARHLRPLDRVLRRPGREEAAQPLPARVSRCCRSAPPAATWPAGSARTGTSPSPARSTRSAAAASPEAARRDGRAAGLPQRRVHLQRPGDLHGVRDGRRRRLPGARHQGGRGDRRLHERRAARGVLRAHGRGERRPQGVHRGLLPEGHVRPARRRAGDAGVPARRDRRLVRDHDAADPGAQRLRRRDRRRDCAWSPSTSAPTCRCTSPRSTPTSRCATCRRTPPSTLRRARGSPASTGCATSTPATCTTPTGSTTYCPGCGEAVVVRDWYVIRALPPRRHGRCTPVRHGAPRRVRRAGRRPGAGAACRSSSCRSGR